jgi:hypothetical protein
MLEGCECVVVVVVVGFIEIIGNPTYDWTRGDTNIKKQISSPHLGIICIKIWNKLYQTENTLDQLVFLTSAFTLSARDVVSLMIQMSSIIISRSRSLSVSEIVVARQNKRKWRVLFLT